MRCWYCKRYSKNNLVLQITYAKDKCLKSLAGNLEGKASAKVTRFARQIKPQGGKSNANAETFPGMPSFDAVDKVVIMLKCVLLSKNQPHSRFHLCILLGNLYDLATSRVHKRFSSRSDFNKQFGCRV